MRCASVAALVVLALAGRAEARALGGGPAKSDCYGVFEGVEGGESGRVVQCSDGAACDADGTVDGRCTFVFTVCVMQPGVPGCNPPDVTRISKRGLSIPTLPTTEPICGGPNTKSVRVNKHAVIRMVTHSSGRPKIDRDSLQFRCRRPAASPSGAFLDP